MNWFRSSTRPLGSPQANGSPQEQAPAMRPAPAPLSHADPQLHAATQALDHHLPGAHLADISPAHEPARWVVVTNAGNPLARPWMPHYRDGRVKVAPLGDGMTYQLHEVPGAAPRVAEYLELPQHQLLYEHRFHQLPSLPPRLYQLEVERDGLAKRAEALEHDARQLREHAEQAGQQIVRLCAEAEATIVCRAEAKLAEEREAAAAEQARRDAEQEHAARVAALTERAAAHGYTLQQTGGGWVLTAPRDHPELPQPGEGEHVIRRGRVYTVPARGRVIRGRVAVPWTPTTLDGVGVFLDEHDADSGRQ